MKKRAIGLAELKHLDEAQWHAPAQDIHRRRRSSDGYTPVDACLTTLGEHLRDARVARDITQQELAAACGTSAQTIRALERGAPGISLGVLAYVLLKFNLLDHLSELAGPAQDRIGHLAARRRAPQRARGQSKRTSSERAWEKQLFGDDGAL